MTCTECGRETIARYPWTGDRHARLCFDCWFRRLRDEAAEARRDRP